MKKITVFLTVHFRERYRERVGNASPAGQKAWLKRSIRRRKPRRISGDIYESKLVGAPYRVYLIRTARDTWVAKTIIPVHWERGGKPH